MADEEFNFRNTKQHITGMNGFTHLFTVANSLVYAHWSACKMLQTYWWHSLELYNKLAISVQWVGAISLDHANLRRLQTYFGEFGGHLGRNQNKKKSPKASEWGSWDVILHKIPLLMIPNIAVVYFFEGYAYFLAISPWTNNYFHV